MPLTQKKNWIAEIESILPSENNEILKFKGYKIIEYQQNWEQGQMSINDQFIDLKDYASNADLLREKLYHSVQELENKIASIRVSSDSGDKILEITLQSNYF